MAEGARVDSIETLQAFKAALWKFQESAQMALGDAESDVNRVLMWVENEQDAFWQGQIRKAEQAVVRCKEVVRMKTVFKDATGRQQSAVDEMKALQVAQKRLVEAQGKLVLVRKWARQLQKEIEMYKGGVQRFATSLLSELPSAAAHLESLAAKLDAYLSLQTSAGDAISIAGAGSGVSAGAMNRGGSAAIAAQPGGAVAQLPIPPIPHEQHLKVAALNVERMAIEGDAAIVIHIEAFGPEAVLRLARSELGWALSANDDAAVSPGRSVRTEDALRERPELSDLLSLPIGFSVIIDASGIVEVLDPGRQAVLRRTDTGDPSHPGELVSPDPKQVSHGQHDGRI